MSEGYGLLKPSCAFKTAPAWSRYRLASGIGFLTLVALLLTTSGPYFFSRHHHLAPFEAHDDVDSVGKCAASIAQAASPPAPVNPWASLTVSEIVQIQDWLFAPQQGLNLTRGDLAVPSDNHVYIIESYYPPKGAVLDYLSSPSSFDLPPRFARVVIHHGAAREPFVKNYLAGPLPIGPQTTLSPLTDIYHIDPIPYNARSFNVRDWESQGIYSNVAAPLSEAFKVSLMQFVYSFGALLLARNYLEVKRPAFQMILLLAKDPVLSASMDPSVACGSVGVVTFQDPFCTP